MALPLSGSRLTKVFLDEAQDRLVRNPVYFSLVFEHCGAHETRLLTTQALARRHELGNELGEDRKPYGLLAQRASVEHVRYSADSTADGRNAYQIHTATTDYY